MKVLRSVSLAVFAIVLSNTFISQASATPITTSFDTTVQYTSGIAGVNVGESFSGSFTYDNDSAVATSVIDQNSCFGGVFCSVISTTYQFSNSIYSVNIYTPSISYSVAGASVSVMNDVYATTLFNNEPGMLSNQGSYDYVSIYGAIGSLSGSGDSLISFGIQFVGNNNMLSDTELPISIDNLLNDPDFIGISLRLSQYALEENDFACSPDIQSFCLGGDLFPVQTGYIYGEEVSAIPTPATLLLIAPGLLALVKLSKRNN